MSLFMTGDLLTVVIVLPTVHHHLVHYLRVITESLPAKMQFGSFSYSPALRKAAALRLIERLLLDFLAPSPCTFLSPDKTSGSSIREKGFLSSVVRTSALLLRVVRSDVGATSGNAQLWTSM